MRVGAILFDPSNNIVASDRTVVSLDSAWASISGGQARRVQSIHDLPSDVVWLTNLTYNNFYRAGLQKHPNFRYEGWLRTLFNQLVAELGIDLNNVSPDITVSTIATIAQRTVNVAQSRYAVSPKASGSTKTSQQHKERCGVRCLTCSTTTLIPSPTTRP